jgi:hypothetical protein
MGPDTRRPPVEDLRMKHGGFRALMAGKLLDRADITAAFEHVCGNLAGFTWNRGINARQENGQLGLLPLAGAEWRVRQLPRGRPAGAASAWAVPLHP